VLLIQPPGCHNPINVMCMSFCLVPQSVTLNDLERRNGPYFASFHRIRVYAVVVKQLGLLGLYLDFKIYF